MNKNLLKTLVCPESQQPLEYDKANQQLICKVSGLAYPIRDGIPVMLVEEASKIEI